MDGRVVVELDQPRVVAQQVVERIVLSAAFPGANGQDGADGADGAPGAPGPQGPPGTLEDGVVIYGGAF